MLDSIRDLWNDYAPGLHKKWDNYTYRLPTNILNAATESALYSFVVSVIVSGTLNAGLENAALGGIVSAMSGLTMPFFRDALSADIHGNIKWYQYAATIVFNLAIAQVLINGTTSQRVNLLGGALFTVAASLLLNGFKDYSTKLSPKYILA